MHHSKIASHKNCITQKNITQKSHNTKITSHKNCITGFVTWFEQDGKIKVNKNLVHKDNDYFRYRTCSVCLPRMPATSSSYTFVKNKTRMDNMNFLNGEDLEKKIDDTEENDRSLIKYDRNA